MFYLPRPLPALALAAAAFAPLALPDPAWAGERRFTFVYEAETEPPGGFEYEQWVTWKTSKQSDSDYDRLDFRHELEFGLTERLQLGLYLADWRYQDGASVRNDRAEYRDTAVELIYNLTNPTTDLIGSALYGEVKLGPELFELEGKLILQKNLGPFTFAYNATIEAEWEGDRYAEDVGKFEQSAGVSYHLMPALSLGAELVHFVEFPDWAEADPSVVYLGPNVSYRASKWFITVTPLFQVTSEAGEPDFQTRLIFGIRF